MLSGGGAPMTVLIRKPEMTPMVANSSGRSLRQLGGGTAQPWSRLPGRLRRPRRASVTVVTLPTTSTCHAPTAFSFLSLWSASSSLGLAFLLLAFALWLLGRRCVAASCGGVVPSAVARWRHLWWRHL